MVTGTRSAARSGSCTSTLEIQIASSKYGVARKGLRSSAGLSGEGVEQSLERAGFSLRLVETLEVAMSNSEQRVRRGPANVLLRGYLPRS